MVTVVNFYFISFDPFFPHISFLFCFPWEAWVAPSLISYFFFTFFHFHIFLCPSHRTPGTRGAGACKFLYRCLGRAGSDIIFMSCPFRAFALCLLLLLACTCVGRARLACMHLYKDTRNQNILACAISVSFRRLLVGPSFCASSTSAPTSN